MANLLPIRQNLDEKQFTQLAFDFVSKKYVISVYFRYTNTFKCRSIENAEIANEWYNVMIK